MTVTEFPLVVEDVADLPLSAIDVVENLLAVNAVGGAVRLALQSLLDAVRGGLTAAYPVEYAANNAQRGLVGNGLSTPLSTFYATLAAAQGPYPHAAALTDELDWAVIQAAVNDADVSALNYGDGHYITNRMIAPRNGQDHFGEGAIIDNIRARNSPFENHHEASVFELGNMHPAIMKLGTGYSWADHPCAAIAAGAKTITVTTPANVTQPLAAGDIVIVRCNNPPEPVGAGVAVTYDFAMWNRVVSWNAGTGVVTLEVPVPVAIAAAGSPTELYGPTLLVNAGTDSFRGTDWWVAQDVTIRDLTLSGLSPVGIRAGAWRCQIRDLKLDCQHLLSANALAFSVAENLTGYFSERFLEVKQFSHDTRYVGIKGVYKKDAAIVPKTPISIGEQTYGCKFDIECDVGRDFTAPVRALDVSGNDLKIGAALRHFGTGAHQDMWAVFSTKQFARPPSDLDFDLLLRGKSGMACYGTIGSDPDVDGVVDDADPTRIRWRVNQKSDGAAPPYSVVVNRGTKLQLAGSQGDAARNLIGAAGECVENGPSIIGVVAGPVTYVAGAEVLVGSYAMPGVFFADDVTVRGQIVGALTAGLIGSLAWSANVNAAGSVSVYVRNKGAADVTVTGASAFFLHALWRRCTP